MKQETNNEMDLLLRQLARRQDVFAPHAGDHLDADELSAYAENVLPAKARARYTEHIAECSRCRGQVVQLSASAGVVIADEAVKVSGPSGWRKFLASLFSPMVLKYAGPALGLIVVAAIGFMVLRRDRPSGLVSQVKNDQAKPAGIASPIDVPEIRQLNDSVTKSADSDSPANKEVPTKSLPQQPATTTPQGTPAPVEQKAPAAKAPEPKPESQPVVAAEPPPPAAAKVDSLSEEKRQKNEDAARKQEAEVKVAAADDSKANFEMSKAKKGEASTTARARVAQSKPAVGDLASAQGAAAPGSARRETVDRDEEKDSSAETKSVGGKRFRKQRGIWIDTAYDNSRGTTNFSRNTEAYRALIADEPGIKTIADQLDGEFIVVWKGRPYRIH